MITRSLLTHAVCCLIGIAGTAIVLKTGGKTDSEETENPRSTPATRRARPDPSQAAKTKQDLTRQLLLSMPDREKYSEREKWLEGLSTSQMPLLLEALCANIGPEGLDYSDKNLIEKTIKRWLKESPEECCAWVEQLPPGAIKRHFLTTMLKELLESDPERALAMSESYQAEDPDWKHAKIKDSHVKGKITTAWKKPDVTAEEMLTLFSELSRGNGYGGSDLRTYPVNFDFQAFLDGVASWNKADDKQPCSMPSDVLEIWARRDPNAAAQWFLQSVKNKMSVPFQNWNDIATAVTETSGAAAYHQWAADIIARATEKQFESIARQIEKRDMLDIADAIQDTPLRDRALSKMANGVAGEGPTQAIALYAEMSTPQARLAVIEGNSQYYFRQWLKEKTLTTADWQKLGLTEAQVRAAVEK